MSTVQHVCFIINSIDPYCWDINQILALPSGFSYRNRWREKWVNTDLRDDITQIKNTKVLLILRDFEKDILIPIRWGIIQVAERIGDVFYFEYELGDLVKFDKDLGARNSQIDAFNREFRARHGDSHRGLNQDIAPSVFLSSIGATTQLISGDDLVAWGNVVDAVGEVSRYLNVEFLKIVKLSSRDGKNSLVTRGRYELLANTVYDMKVFQKIPKPGEESVKPHDIELTTLPTQITILRGQQRAVGKYDMLRFIFKVGDLNPGESSFLDMSLLPKEGVDSALRSMYLPVVIQKQIRPIIIRGVVTAVALLFTFEPDFFGLLPDSEITRSLALIVVIISVVGWRRVLNSYWPST
jgi:hypothetical protein